MMGETVETQIEKLKSKYESMGQDMNAYLDGLLLANYVPYWEYVHLDTLLTLQKPRTDFPDEKIFIMYHQITELYFNLCLHEFDQISKNGKIIEENGQDKGWNETISAGYLKERVRRINAYFEALTKSYDIMVQGMEKEQFLRFRMALLPASGFQSVQYRKIEICSTDLKNLIHIDHREAYKNHGNSDKELTEIFDKIYWKAGATEMASGTKTLTLKQFEKRYTEELVDLAIEYREGNIWQKYLQLPEADRKDESLIQGLKDLDANVNINWPLVHYKSAVRYLQLDPSDIAATGGTNWQKYLPPRFMKRIFFPKLWSDEGKENWGKAWVETNVGTP
jgi:tryptophan 2,3-dioxygenase